MLKCTKCSKTFPIPAHLSTEAVPNQYSGYSTEGKVTRVIFDQPVCPHCKSPEITDA